MTGFPVAWQLLSYPRHLSTTYSLVDVTQTQQMVEVLKTVQHTATCGAVCKACFPVWVNVALVRAVSYAMEMGPLSVLIDEQLQG